MQPAEKLHFYEQFENVQTEALSLFGQHVHGTSVERQTNSRMGDTDDTVYGDAVSEQPEDSSEERIVRQALSERIASMPSTADPDDMYAALHQIVLNNFISNIVGAKSQTNSEDASSSSRNMVDCISLLIEMLDSFFL